MQQLRAASSCGASTCRRQQLQPFTCAGPEAAGRRRVLTCRARAQPSPAPASLPHPPPAGDGASTHRRTALLLGLLAAGELSQALPARATDVPAVETVFVAGATGNTGRRVVQQLRAAGYRVRAGVRDVRKAQSLGWGFDSGIDIVEADVVKGASELEAAIGPADAVICTTGFSGGLNPFGSGSAAAVDEQGTISLVNAAKARRVQAFVLLSSLLTNAPAVGQAANPNYAFLQLFGGVLSHKLAAENYLRRSGLRWTIVRPGGLKSEAPAEVGRLVTSREDSLFGLETDPGRAISRDTVAAVLVAALRQPLAADKVVEIVAAPDAPELPEDAWFAV